MTSDDLLQSKSVMDGTFAILAERATWQKNFSLFRYFGLLPLLEVLPLGVVSRGRRGEPLKGRSQNRNQEIYFNPSASPEELYIQVDKFVAAPPSGFPTREAPGRPNSLCSDRFSITCMLKANW